MRRRGRTAAALTAAVVMGMSGLNGTATAHASRTSQAADVVGNDISWPQCPVRQGGYGNPMPSTGTAFVVVGTTRGLPFTANPCLTEQARWIRNAARPFHAYAMAGYPTRDQYARYGSRGPFGSANVLDRLRNVGYAEATDSIAALRRVGLRPPMVWIDVEKRTRQPWPDATTDPWAAARNRAVLEGMLEGHRRAGLPAGFYSNPQGWAAITGGWQRPDVPFWETVGTRGRSVAAARCGRPGQNGGPVHLSQWWDARPMDWNMACPGFRPAAPAPTLSWPAVSARTGVRGRTAVVLTAGPSRRQTWQLTVTDECTGRTVHRSPVGVTADRIVARWDGRRGDGRPAPVGLYRLTLRTGTHAPPSGPVLTSLYRMTDTTGRGGTCRGRTRMF